MGTSSVKVWIGLGLAALGIAAIAGAASSSSPSPTPPTPPTPAPWTIKQGERYRVTVAAAAPGFNAAINWTPIVQIALDAAAPGDYHVVSSVVPLPAANLVFVVDALGPTHIEPSGTFTSFSFPSPLTVLSIDDLGPSPPTTAGLVSPAAPPSPAVAPPPPAPGSPVAQPSPVPLPSPAAPVTSPTPSPAAPAPAAPAPSAGGPTAAQLQAASNFSFLTGGSAQWVQGPGVSANGRGRVTIPVNSAPATLAHFVQWVQTSSLPSLFGNALFIWAPTDALPPDWPADDPNAGPGAGWHFEFVSQNASQSIGAADIATAMNAGPSFVTLWSAQGSGPAQLTRPIVLNWQPVTQLDPGAHVRMTVAQSDLATIAQAVGLTGVVSGGAAACSSFLQLVQFAGFDQLVTNGSPLVLIWCGSDFLPPDWPTPDSLGDFHLEFRVLPSTGTGALIDNLPFPVLGAWQAQGPGA